MDLKAVTRELQADERPLLLAHLLALGQEDRSLRFEHALSDEGVRRYVEGICLSRDAVFQLRYGMGSIPRGGDRNSGEKSRAARTASQSARTASPGASTDPPGNTV